MEACGRVHYGENNGRVGWVMEACDLIWIWILVGSLLESNVLMSVSMEKQLCYTNPCSAATITSASSFGKACAHLNLFPCQERLYVSFKFLFL